MAEEKKVTTDEAAEAPTPEKKAINSDIREMIESDIVPEGDTVEADQDEETSEPLSDPSTDENDDSTQNESSDELEDIADEDGEESKPIEDDIEGLLDNESEGEDPKRTGTDKRIDKLTKRLYDLERENKELKEKPAEKPKEPGQKKYTREQLVKALDNARNEGNTDLELEIMEHISNSKALEVEAKYKAKEDQQIEAQRKAQVEWTTIVQMNEHLTDQDIEFYPDSNKDLNLTDGDSLLYRLAKELYTNHGYREKENGMSLAVSDALKRILAKKKKSAKAKKSPKEKSLETKVKKLKRKTSSPSGGKTIKSDPVKKDASLKKDGDKVRDAISERKEQNAWKYI